MKKLLFIFFLSIVTSKFLFAWSYPLKLIAKPGCKFEIWKNLSSDCKMQLPRIENANYRKYKNNILYRLVYSVLWTATYKNGWDIGYGSHGGIDIPTSLGTPVYSIGDGTVQIAGYRRGWGNVVVIRHYIGNGKYIRSVYAHLSKIDVKKGQYVKEGEKIGEVGHTGNAWGNHLHFQIDINQDGYHPYFPRGCGRNLKLMVNKGLCKDKVIENTIDPIYFLESHGANILKNISTPKIKEIPKKIVKKETIKPTEIIPREQLKLTELQLFLERYKISLKSYIPANVLQKNKTGIMKIFVKNRRGKPFSGILPQDLQIQTTIPGVIKVIPTGIKYFSNGQRDIKITGLKPGTTDIIIKIDQKILFRKTIRVIDKNTIIKPYSAYGLLLSKNPHIGDQIWGLILLRDKNYNNIIKVPFKGNFLVKIENGKICPVFIKLSDIKRINQIKCSAKDAKNYFWFNYKKSLLGIQLFKVIPTNFGKKIKIYIYNQNGKLFGNIKTFATIKRPKDFNKLYVWNLKYKTYIKKALKNLLVGNYKNGYFAPDFKLKTKTAILWIKNLKYLLTKNDKLTYYPEKNYYITRYEFIKLLSKNLNLKSNKNYKVFLDTSKDMRKYTNLLEDFDAKFLDRFGKKFFQPNKPITRQEAGYILEKFYEKL